MIRILDRLVRPTRADVRYKVWVQIERIELHRDGESYDNIGLPDPIGVYDTLEAAQRHVRTLPGWYPDGSDNR